MVAGFWVWWPAFGWLSCYGFAGFVVGTWWVLFCFVFLFLFFYFGFLVLVSGVWVGFGWRLGGVWVGVRWLDLGPVIVIFSDGLGDLFRWV